MSRSLAIFFAAALLLGAPVAPAGRQGAPSQGVTTTGWPRTFQENGSQIVVYQPQVESWPNYTVLNGLAAVQVTLPASAPLYGTIKLSAYTAADFDNGIVTLTNLHITGTTWPGQSGDVAARLEAAVKSIPTADKTIPSRASWQASTPRRRCRSRRSSSKSRRRYSPAKRPRFSSCSTASRSSRRSETRSSSLRSTPTGRSFRTATESTIF